MEQTIRSMTAGLLMAAAALLALAGTARAGEAVQPPWSKPLVTGVNITVPGVDNVPDLHGDINDPDLVIFFAGNQYMLVNELLGEFQKKHPDYPRVFAETLPPGILARQITEGALVIGNMRIRLQPDIFTAGHGRMMALQSEHGWFSETRNYARNHLAIMTYKGNPKGVTGWRDLAKKDIRLCMPNPKWEGIAQHAIIPALEATGGQELVDGVYKDKVADGSTFLTHIHHRQTPMRVMAGECDAGAVWYTEAYFHAKLSGHPTAMVEIPANQNKVVTYTAGIMKKAPHAKAARAFMDFLTGPEGQAIYRHYGFMPPPAAK
ncbi:MAG: substrate-binding domain-containing protein [Gammaproteobacteria bacterium]